MLKLISGRSFNYKMKNLHTDFWDRFGHSYSIFSMYSDYDDWRNILDEICREINNLQFNRTVNLLDIGAGIGKNTNEIIEIMLSRYKKNILVDVVEPSVVARDYIKTILIEKRFGGFLNKVSSDISKLKKNKYDVILFMHSSYYITNFTMKLLYLYNNYLSKRGKILILSLPSNSIFFLKQKELKLPNTSDDIQSFLKSTGISFKLRKLNSKFATKIKHQNNSQTNHFYKFFTRKEISLKKFTSLFKTNINGRIANFRDELIIIEK
jgi:hypothetical protein